MSTVGERIRDLRIRNNLTLDDVAKYLGVGRQAVYKYEHGTVTNIPLENIEKMAKLFNVAPGYISCWTDETGNADTSSNRSADLGAIQPDEADIIKTYRSLPAPGKQYVQQQLVAARLMYGEKPADSAVADK